MENKNYVILGILLLVVALGTLYYFLKPATFIGGQFTTKAACEDYAKSQWCTSGSHCAPCYLYNFYGTNYYSTDCYPQVSMLNGKTDICSGNECVVGTYKCDGNDGYRCPDQVPTKWVKSVDCTSGQTCVYDGNQAPYCRTDSVTYSCSDTDGGSSYLQKGVMTVKNCGGVSGTDTYTDSCSSNGATPSSTGKYVLEFSCNFVSQNNCEVVSFQAINCETQNGGTCQDGKCVPACVKTSCSAEGKNCGSISDGCGGTLNCGSCSSTQTCTSSNVCSNNAVPKTCEQLGKTCGTWSNEAGGTVNCGNCDTGLSCNSGVCEVSAQCTTANQATTCNDNSACTADTCVGGFCVNSPCPAGLSCINNACAATPSCTTDTECNDGEVCTVDSCLAGSCSFVPIVGCGVDTTCQFYESKNADNTCSISTPAYVIGGMIVLIIILLLVWLIKSRTGGKLFN